MPSGCGCDVKTEIEGQGTYVPWPSVFYILVPDWNLVSNYNRQTAASNASVNTHSPFLLVGDYTPNPAERRIHSAAARSANAFFGGVLKRLLIEHLSSFCPFPPILGRGCLVCFNKKTHLGRWGGNIPPHPAI